MLPPGSIPLSRRVYLPEHEFSMDFAGLKQMRMRKAIATPPASSKCLRIFPEQRDVSENVEQTQTTRKRRTQKGNVGNIEDATQLQKAKNTQKQRNCIIRKTTLPPAAGRDVPQNPVHLRVLHP